MGVNLPAVGAGPSLAAPTFVNEDLDAFVGVLDRSAPTARPTKLSHVRGIFDDSSTNTGRFLIVWQRISSRQKSTAATRSLSLCTQTPRMTIGITKSMISCSRIWFANLFTLRMPSRIFSDSCRRCRRSTKKLARIHTMADGTATIRIP